MSAEIIQDGGQVPEDESNIHACRTRYRLHACRNTKYSMAKKGEGIAVIMGSFTLLPPSPATMLSRQPSSRLRRRCHPRVAPVDSSAVLTRTSPLQRTVL